MKNINNKNLIFYSLGVALAILAILMSASILIPKKAHAEYAYYHFNSSDNNAPLYPTPTPPVIPVYQPVYQTQPVVYQTQPVYQNNSYSNPPAANTSTTNVSNNTTTKTSTTGVTTSDYKNLTANSVFGRFSFMPSGLMQWILLAIFILVIVILIRKVTGKDEEYQNTPLKHA